MLAPQSLDVQLTFSNGLGNMLRFRDASHWFIPGLVGGAQMSSISLPSVSCINVIYFST